MNSKIFWYTLMAGTILLYAISLFIGRLLFPDNCALSLLIFAGILILHIFEIPHARAISRARGLSLSATILMTILFGFTWWLPLKKGIL